MLHNIINIQLNIELIIWGDLILKLNRLLLVSIILLAFLTFGAVNAADSTAVDVSKTSIVAHDVNMTHKDGSTYNVQIVDDNDNPVAFPDAIVNMTVSNKTYKIKTNASGTAVLPIKLPVGKYTIFAEYNGKTINNTITVNKAK